MNNLLYRFLTAVILLPVVLAALIKGGPFLLILLALVSFAGCIEIALMVLPGSQLVIAAVCLFWAGLFGCSIYALPHKSLIFFIPIFFIFNAVVLFSENLDAKTAEKMTSLFYWVSYVVLGVSSVHWLSNLSDNGLPIGFSFIILACVSTWSNDTCAYFGGRFFGKRPLFKRVSSKKTWEGFFAGFIGSFLGVLLLLLLSKITALVIFAGLTPADYWWIILPSTILAPLGDLIESRLKRLYDAKDSSHILPGHGGILDRIDGLLMVLPWTAFYAFIIRSL